MGKDITIFANVIGQGRKQTNFFLICIKILCTAHLVTSRPIEPAAVLWSLSCQLPLSIQPFAIPTTKVWKSQKYFCKKLRTQSVINYARSGKQKILQTEKALPWPSPMALDNGWDLQRIYQSINQSSKGEN